MKQIIFHKMLAALIDKSVIVYHQHILSNWNLRATVTLLNLRFNTIHKFSTRIPHSFLSLFGD